MSFLGFVLRSVASRKTRMLLTGLAIAISIMTVVTMGVLTHSLRKTAINVIRTGQADFTVAEEGLSDVLFSAIDEEDVDTIAAMDGVERAIGVLIAPQDLDEDHPVFLQIGLNAGDLEPFGVTIVVGEPFRDGAQDQILLGFRAARDLQKTIGDAITIDDNTYTVVGIYRTGEVSGDSASMLSRTVLQAQERKPGTVTLAFVQAEEGADLGTLRAAIEAEFPQLATVQTASDFGRVDRNLELISAANTGVSILALVIGAITVANTMMLSVFERTREFGILRAVGWPRLRIVLEVMSEAVALAFASGIVGVAAGFGMVQIVKTAPELSGVFEPDYPEDVFLRALAIAFGMAIIGALYPAIRAALLQPLAALRHE